MPVCDSPGGGVKEKDMARFIPAQMTEYIGSGKLWRLEIGYTSVTNGSYIGIGFTTPATGFCVASTADIQKTGGEVMVTALEGATIGGTPSALTPRNYNRVIGDASNPFTATVSSDTATGGTVIGSKLLGGAGTPAVAPGGASTATVFFTLKPSTTYFWKMEAEAANVTLEAHIDLLWTDGTMV